VILAADCCYFEPSFPLLLSTLGDLLDLWPEATVFFCFRKRRRADLHFLKSAKKVFEAAELDDDDRSVFGREGVFLYRFRKRGVIGRV
jgi:protein N-lysine methyltransferase METTL21A